MECLILGSGSGLPHADRGSPAWVARTRSAAILIDCGGGALRRLAEHKIHFHWITHTIMTGIEASRSGDLANFLWAKAAMANKKRSADLEILGPARTGEWISELRLRFGIADDPAYSVGATDIGEETALSVGDMDIRMLPIAQRLGLRIDHPTGSFAYLPAEPEPAQAERLAAGCSFLIAETPVPARHKVSGQLSPRDAGEWARRVRAERLLLTGLDPVADRHTIEDAAAQAFGKEVFVATDGMRFGL